MITRVTDQMKFDLLNNSMSTIQSKYNDLMEKLSVQKQVNKPSDDPGGMGKILDYRSAKAQISNYQKNVDSSKSWLSATESNLSSVNDIITQVKEMVIAQSSATTSASTRQIAADALQPLIDQVRSLANGMIGNRYLFTGTKTASDTQIDTPAAASGNTFDGTVSVGAGSAYTGASNDKTFITKITQAGTLGAAKYEVSSDGGTTWGTEQTIPAGGNITVGDGITLTFTAGTIDFAVDDVFTVDATRRDIDPFSATASAARIDTPVTGSENTYTGTVSAAGTYIGATNKTYVAKIITGGALGAATYKVSSDGGKIWGAVQTIPAGGNIAMGDGISMTFTAGTFAANDVFYVHAYAPGYYNGNGEDLASEVGKDLSINYNITGETVFTDRGQGTVDIFQTLNDLKTALQNNDAAGIANQLDPLSEAQNQINRYVGRCGTRTNSLDTSSSTLEEMDARITGLTSNIEDADVAKLVTEFQMKQVALQASYKMAGDLTTNSIVNFLR
jgi:flagellar hook-associated protein 3 FlgL